MKIEVLARPSKDGNPAIQPTHLETSLYVAALEVASRRGYPASEVRVFSPLPQFVDGGRWFDGSAWFFTWRHALIEAIQEEAKLYPLDLIAWREQPPPEEGVELLAVLRAREHKWTRLYRNEPIDMTKVDAKFSLEKLAPVELGEGCSRCLKLKPRGRAEPAHEWVRGIEFSLVVCRNCASEKTRNTEGTYCDAFVQSPMCYHELLQDNFRESTI